MRKAALSIPMMALVAFFCVQGVSRASVFASSLVSSQFVTSFGSGNVTGAPDGGGLFLGDTFDPPAHPGFIIVHFNTPLIDGPGDDIRVIDVVNSTNETANISVSSDGINFTLIGGLNAVANTINVAGLFAGQFSYIKVANSSTLVSIDVDAVEGINAVTIPEPATFLSIGCGLCGLLVFRRRRQR